MLLLGFGNQPVAFIGVGVCAIERFFESPVRRQRGRGRLLHLLKMPQRGVDAVIR